MKITGTEHWQRSKTDIELVREADRPPPETAFSRELYDKRDHPEVLAEIARRKLDVEAVRRRIRAIVAELRKLPHIEVVMLSIDADGDGRDLSVVASDFLLGRFDDEK